MNSVFIPPCQLKTALLLLVFNRLETTKQVFEKIRQAKPPRLYLAADGPREAQKGDTEKVRAVREYLLNNIDWDCEVKTLFRDMNLGCKYAPHGGIQWFFDNEEMGIILEDDCVPSQSFFWFCEELLERYKNDKRIMLISGFNKQETWNTDQYDYFFSQFGGIGGWASWRSAWQHMDLEMNKLQEFIDGNYFYHLLGGKMGKIREKQMLNSPPTAWDFPWGFSRHVNSGLACVPTKNLIKNIGYGEDATHTQGSAVTVNNYEINLPVKENIFVIADRRYDEQFLEKISIYDKFKCKIKSFLK